MRARTNRLSTPSDNESANLRVSILPAFCAATGSAMTSANIAVANLILFTMGSSEQATISYFAGGAGFGAAGTAGRAAGGAAGGFTIPDAGAAEVAAGEFLS